MEKTTKGKIINDFTEGSILKKMLLFSIPFMISNGLQVLYSLVDMVVVGKFVGSFGLSAVSISSQAFLFLTMLCVGFANGGQVYVAQLIGSGQRDKLNRTIGTLFTIVLSMGVVVMILGILFGRPFLTLLDTPPESYEMAWDYFFVCSIGMVFAYGYNMVSAVLRGMGDSRHPFIFVMIASVINLVLDIIFVGPMNMGTAGAALATILGQGFSFVYSIIYLYRNRVEFGFDFKLKSWAVDKAVAVKLCTLGVPFAVQSAAINISMLYVNKLVNGVGVYASALFGVGLKVDDIVNKVTHGILYAVSAMVGQNIAAGKIDRVKKTVWYSFIVCGVCYALFTLVLIFFAEPLYGLFTDDVNVIELSDVFVSAILWSFPGMALLRGANGLIQGIGNARLSLVFGMLDAIVMRIGLSFLFGIVFDFGLYGFILGYGLAVYGTVIPGLLYFLSGKWKNYKRLTSKE